MGGLLLVQETIFTKDIVIRVKGLWENLKV